MARFDRWAWRKLYIPEKGTFANLPALCRGLAAELVKIVDEEGCLFAAKDGLEITICRRLGAHPRECRQIRSFITLLREEGYLISLGGGVWKIRNFAVPHCSREVSDGSV